MMSESKSRSRGQILQDVLMLERGKLQRELDKVQEESRFNPASELIELYKCANELDRSAPEFLDRLSALSAKEKQLKSRIAKALKTGTLDSVNREVNLRLELEEIDRMLSQLSRSPVVDRLFN